MQGSSNKSLERIVLHNQGWGDQAILNRHRQEAAEEMLIVDDSSFPK